MYFWLRECTYGCCLWANSSSGGFLARELHIRECSRLSVGQSWTGLRHLTHLHLQSRDGRLEGYGSIAGMTALQILHVDPGPTNTPMEGQLEAIITSLMPLEKLTVHWCRPGMNEVCFHHSNSFTLASKVGSHFYKACLRFAQRDIAPLFVGGLQTTTLFPLIHCSNLISDCDAKSGDRWSYVNA